MFTVSGKYNTAKVMTNAGIDDATMSQIIEMCNLESLAGESLAIMPDCHAGGRLYHRNDHDNFQRGYSKLCRR